MKNIFPLYHTQNKWIGEQGNPVEPPSTYPRQLMARTPHTKSTESSLRLNTENTVNPTTNYQVSVKFDTTRTEDKTSKLKNLNQTLVIQKMPWVGQTQTQKTKILLTLTTINLTHLRTADHEERELPQGKMRGATPQTPKAHLTRTKRETKTFVSVIA